MSQATIQSKCDFNCEEACKTLKEAMDGMGTNEDSIIATLVDHDNAQRQEIQVLYKQLYGEDLIENLKSELTGNLENVIIALFDSPRRFDAHEIHRAIDNAGTEETTLIEIMVTRNNEEIEEIKTIYQEEYENSMEDDIASDTSGNFRRMLVSLCTASRDDNWWVDEDKAKEDAQALFDAGEGQLGTDESVLNSIFCQRTLPQLNATFDMYAELADKTIQETVESETSGAVKDGYLAIIEAAIDLRKYFANQLYKSMKGLGTSDTDLIRVIVSRCEIDLNCIKDTFQEIYGEPLSEWVAGECGGDYKKIMLALLK